MRIQRYLLTALSIMVFNNIAQALPLDSLPVCIAGMKKIYPRLSATLYDYKGQTWFLVVQDTLADKVIKDSDHQTYLKFYNRDCQLMCTWTKGGIAALNRMIPDTIEKDKIKKMGYPKQEDIHLGGDSLPAAIIAMAKQLNAVYIKQYAYGEQSLFFLETIVAPSYDLAKKGISTIVEKYYNSDGKWVATFRRATSGMFLRAQHWEPVSFVPSKLVAGKNKWIKRNDEYVLE